MPINNPDAKTWFTLHSAYTDEPIALDVDQYPDGSFAFRSIIPYDTPVVVTLKSTLPQAVFALFQISALLEAVRATNSHYVRHYLVIQTFPDQRADKQKKAGEVNAAAVTAELLTHLKFDSITVHDPHSDMFVSVLDERKVQVYGIGNKHYLPRLEVVSSLACFKRALASVHSRTPMQHDYVVAVDEGAVDRAEHFAAAYGTGIIYADKARNVEGAIVGHKLNEAKTGSITVTSAARLWVIDDLCDAGGTFVSVAALLDTLYPQNKRTLYVTHSLQHDRASDRLAPYYDQFMALFTY